LFTGDVEALHVKAADNRIELNVTDEDFIKDALDSVGSGSSLLSKLAQLKGIAEELKEEGVTVTVSYRGDRLVTMGAGAKSKFSRVVTRTDAVEISNLRKLMRLAV
jgi:hypothetical protein